MRRQAGQLRLHAIAIHDDSYKRCRQEAFDDARKQRGRVENVGWVRDEADVEEEHGKDAGEEDERRRGARREQRGEDDRHGQEGPAQVHHAAGCMALAHERERLGEVRVEGVARDAVVRRRREAVLVPDDRDNAAAAELVLDDAGVDGGLADERVGAVDGLASGEGGGGGSS